MPAKNDATRTLAPETAAASALNRNRSLRLTPGAFVSCPACARITRAWTAHELGIDRKRNNLPPVGWGE